MHGTIHHQRKATLFNRLRSWLAYDAYERVRCHDCREDRLIRQDPLLDADAPAQECGACGSSRLWPIKRQSSAAFCPGCEHDLLHQHDATIKEGDAVTQFTCQYCGTTSGWLLGAPAPLRAELKDDTECTHEFMPDDATPEPQLVDGGQRLFVDFDNTITKDDVEYWNGERPEVDPIVAERVRSHYYAGGTVVVWTARPWSEAHRIAAHLTEWQIPYHGLRCEKGSGDTYVDDKSKHPGEF